MNNEYPIHTLSTDYENLKHGLLSWGIPIIVVIGLSIWTFASLPDIETTKTEKHVKPFVPHVRTVEEIEHKQDTINSDQYGNLSLAIQRLLSHGLNVQTVSANGVVSLGVGKSKLECGFLDSTPQTTSDNDYPQYYNVSTLASVLEIPEPDQTFIFWEDNIGILPKGSSREMIDTNFDVLACPELSMTQ